MMELSPDQVRSVLVSAGMGDDLPLFESAGQAKRPRGRDRVPATGKPVRGNEPAAAGNAATAAEGSGDRAGEGARKRRSRRGGKNTRRGLEPGNMPENGQTAGQGKIDTGETAGNRTMPAESPARADAVGSEGGAVTGSGDRLPGNAPGPGRNSRNRSRRNFRGRTGRRGKAAAGEGGAEAGNTGAGDIGNSDAGNRGNRDGENGGNESEGGGNDGNR